MNKRTHGLSLLEILLVFAIIGLIIIMGMRQYTYYKADADRLQLQNNVDAIFSGMSQYFRANCETFSTATKVLSLQTDLIDAGFMPSLPVNPLVDYTDPNAAYIVQFNRQPFSNRVMTGNITAGPVTGTQTSQSTSTTRMGQSIVWEAQVSVLLKDQSSLTAIYRMLNANCISISSGFSVTPCAATNPSNATYVVWTRSPSLSNTTYNSNLWLSNPLVRQFKQMYTTYPGVSVADVNGPTYANQYFRCGG